MRAWSWIGATFLALLVLAAACSDGEQDGDAGAPGRAGEGGDGGASDGATPGGSTQASEAGQAPGGAFVEGGVAGVGGSPEQDTTRVRFVNALFGSKTAHDGLLNYELYPFDPFIVDVYMAGRSEPLFTSIAPGSAESVTRVVDVPEQDAPTSVRFELRISGASPDSTPLLVSDDVVLPPGGTATLVATGDSGPNAEHAAERAVLLPMLETAGAATDGIASIRVISAAHQDRLRVSVDGLAIGNIIQYSVTPEPGVQLMSPPVRVEVSGNLADSIFAETAFFTVPSGALNRSRDYLMIVTGLGQLRPADDPLALCLLLVPADGDARAETSRLLQDPVVGWLNMLRPHAGARPVVDVLAGDRTLAKALPYGGELPRFSTLRPEDDGAPVRVIDSVTSEVLYEAGTGSLQVGQRYLAVLSGDPFADAEDRRPILSLVPDELPLDPRFRQSVLLHAVTGAGRLTFGNWEISENDKPEGPFTPIIGPVEYGETSSLDGTQVSLPGELELGAAQFTFVGVQAQQERRVSEIVALALEPSFFVVVGDWSDPDLDLLQVLPRQHGWRTKGPLSLR